MVPDWPAPQNVCAIQTLRWGGVSLPPFDTLNLGDHVGDDALAVAHNRQLLNRIVPTEPVWLKQVHGKTVIDAAYASCQPEADASVAFLPAVVCAVMTADCLPVLLCDTAGSVVGAVHAGWRGLAAGVIDAAVSALQVPPETLMAWLGPAIGPTAFEVGADVLESLSVQNSDASLAFSPIRDGKWLADIYTLARQRLHKLGVRQVYGGDLCTFTAHEQFFSYRRDGNTGRMATLIWLERL
jgi:hypothetical protein